MMRLAMSCSWDFRSLRMSLIFKGAQGDYSEAVGCSESGSLGVAGTADMEDMELWLGGLGSCGSVLLGEELPYSGSLASFPSLALLLWSAVPSLPCSSSSCLWLCSDLWP